ncbi:MAG: PaaI family thioesterase [Blautia sp.]|nr:PaaI family thioesterase [Blautia sp.]
MNPNEALPIGEEEWKRVEVARVLAKDKFGITFPEIRRGDVTAQLVVEKKHLNAFGICFGTFIFNLADLACGVAYLTMGGFGPTVDGNISFINGAKEGDVLSCRGQVVKYGKKISFLQGEIRTGEGVLIANTDFRFYHL